VLPRQGFLTKEACKLLREGEQQNLQHSNIQRRLKLGFWASLEFGYWSLDLFCWSPHRSCTGAGSAGLWLTGFRDLRRANKTMKIRRDSQFPSSFARPHCNGIVSVLRDIAPLADLFVCYKRIGGVFSELFGS